MRPITVAAVALLMMVFLGNPVYAGDERLAVDFSLKAVKAAGTIIVGFDEGFPPMTFKDKKGEVVGFDIDFAREAVRRMRLKIEFKAVRWDDIIPSLNRGDVDVIWSGLNILDERQHQMSFSKPYLQNGQVILVKKGSGITRLDQLEGKKIGYEKGSTSEITLRTKEAMQNLFGAIIDYPDNEKAMGDLEAGSIDALIVDKIMASYSVKAKPKAFFILPGEYGKELCGIGFRKSDIELRDAVDAIVDEMKKDGFLDKIAKKWFGTSAPIIP